MKTKTKTKNVLLTVSKSTGEWISWGTRTVYLRESTTKKRLEWASGQNRGLQVPCHWLVLVRPSFPIHWPTKRFQGGALWSLRSSAPPVHTTTAQHGNKRKGREDHLHVDSKEEEVLFSLSLSHPSCSILRPGFNDSIWCEAAAASSSSSFPFYFSVWNGIRFTWNGSSKPQLCWGSRKMRKFTIIDIFLSPLLVHHHFTARAARWRGEKKDPGASSSSSSSSSSWVINYYLYIILGPWYIFVLNGVNHERTGSPLTCHHFISPWALKVFFFFNQVEFIAVYARQLITRRIEWEEDQRPKISF